MSELSSDVNLVSIKARQDNVKSETKQQYEDMGAEIRFLAALVVGKVQDWTRFSAFG